MWWRCTGAERGGKYKKYGADTQIIKVPCMHDGCEPREHGKGYISIAHDEGKKFKLPRGVRFECWYCKQNGPPSERMSNDGIMAHAKWSGEWSNAGFNASFDPASVVACNVNVRWY